MLPKNKHLIGKIFTQCIGRESLTLCIRIKRLNRKIQVIQSPLKYTIKSLVYSLLVNTVFNCNQRAKYMFHDTIYYEINILL
ncbi:hypothetical protein J8V57_04520 [Xenorhabdus sp. PB61.4]|nr:hypothetical protein [Xenorhabdus sp. PB61.4]